MLLEVCDFNPPAREGRDVFLGRLQSLIFISTHPPVKGGTQYHVNRGQQPHYFNPPAREGRDVVSSHVQLYRVLFQPTRP